MGARWRVDLGDRGSVLCGYGFWGLWHWWVSVYWDGIWVPVLPWLWLEAPGDSRWLDGLAGSLSWSSAMVFRVFLGREWLVKSKFEGGIQEQFATLVNMVYGLGRIRFVEQELRSDKLRWGFDLDLEVQWH